MKLSRLWIVLLLPLSFNGCVAAVVVGTTSAMVLMQQDQNIDNLAEDRNIQKAINKRLHEAKAISNADDIKIVVDNTRVILLGYMHSKEALSRLIVLIEEIPNVSEINNEITVKASRAMSRTINDKRLGMQIKSRLLGNKNVDAGNFKILVFDRVAYIFGVTKSDDEIKELSLICATTAGITKVVSYAIFYK